LIFFIKKAEIYSQYRTFPQSLDTCRRQLAAPKDKKHPIDLHPKSRPLFLHSSASIGLSAVSVWGGLDGIGTDHDSSINPIPPFGHQLPPPIAITIGHAFLFKGGI
jgi:hypothetical protein